MSLKAFEHETSIGSYRRWINRDHIVQVEVHPVNGFFAIKLHSVSEEVIGYLDDPDMDEFESWLEGSNNELPILVKRSKDESYGGNS